MAARKILGALILGFIGIPVLFGIIWAVGMVRATVSSEFLTEVPREIINEIPGALNGLYADLRDERIHLDPGARAWLEAAEKTGIPPAELLEKTGLLAWMKGELSDSLRQVGEILRGESDMRRIEIDMRPLKTALLHPEMTRFIERTLENLPVCTDQNLQTWQARLDDADHGGELPACRPDLAGAKDVLMNRISWDVNRIDDSVQVLESSHPFPIRRMGISRFLSTVSYLLFLLPALFIFLGAVLADPTTAGKLRWSGISILIGSVPVLIMAFFLKKVTSWAIGLGSWGWSGTSPWETALADKLAWIPDRILSALFTPVFNTAGVVAVLGIVLIALSATRGSAAAAPAVPPAVKS